MARVNRGGRTARAIESVKSADFATHYSNNAGATATPWDLRLRFGRIVEATPKKLVIEESVDVFMSPEHALAFYQALGDNLRRFEKSYGPIRNYQETIAREARASTSGQGQPSSQSPAAVKH